MGNEISLKKVLPKNVKNNPARKTIRNRKLI
jgi:hypothetical protein